MAPSVAKTLIIRFSSVGDIILSSLLIRTFRRRFPDAQIDFLVKAEYADLLRGNPHLTRVLEFPAGGTFADLTELRRKVQAANYDLIVDIHGNLRSRYLCLASRRVRRYHKRTLARRALVLCKWNLYGHEDPPPSVALRYLGAVRHLGVADDGEGLEVFLDDHDRNVARSQLQQAGLEGVHPLLGIAPSARHRTKIWPPDRYARAATRLLSQRGGGVALLGAEHDRETCHTLQEELHRSAPGIPIANLAGTMSLTETAAVMDHCDLLLTNDSGLMHLGAARKRPLVAVFGPTVREFGFFPLGPRTIVVERRGLSCRPCTTIGSSRCPRGHFRCMLETSAEEVAGAAEQVLTP